MSEVLVADNNSSDKHKSQNGIRQRVQVQQQTSSPQQSSSSALPPPHERPSRTTNVTTKLRNRQWRLPQELTSAQEKVFLNMQLRKMNRALTGTKSRDKKYEFVLLAILLITIYSFGAQGSSGGGPTTVNIDDPIISLTLGEVIIIGVWLYVAVFVTETFKESKFIELLHWMLIYIPFLAMVVSFVFGDRDEESDDDGGLRSLWYNRVVWILFIIAESMTVLIFVSIYYLYPRMLNSDWFRQKDRVASYWKVNTVAEWTMTYKTHKTLNRRKRFTCKYEGEMNERGEPHGLGRWFDDSFDGEVLTGTWQNGLPVAPFYSRHYGRGDTFSAVRIAYVMASDDEFAAIKFWPTNEIPPRCGVASVECSVSGSFYNELPFASKLGPEDDDDDRFFDAKTSVERLCQNLAHSKLEDEINMLQIKASGGSRGVSVKGHVHGTTGKTVHDVDEILIRVKKERDTPSETNTSELYDEVETGNINMVEERKMKQEQKRTLVVDKWLPTKHREALVFIPGFNCCLKKALESFGQLMAMTKLDSHVYPILYQWPCGQVLTYHSASRVSQNEQNFENFHQLMKGLQNAGITNVHLMSHSMGVQTLLGALCDKTDGSRSDVSRCFQLAPGQQNDDEENGNIGQEEENPDGGEEDTLLVCKTLTMLNPDYPLEAFVSHAFRSARKICDTITVVGDKHDGALFWSQVVNGVSLYFFRYEQPANLEPNNYNREHCGYQSVIGRAIEELYLPDNLASDRSLKSELMFHDRAPLALVTEDDEDLEKAWLDLDVIDISGLDTNIADIRHSAYNLNPTLLNDLEELITTGQRAMKRSSLLYRDGNVFSYCHAPSYVAF